MLTSTTTRLTLPTTALVLTGLLAGLAPLPGAAGEPVLQPAQFIEDTGAAERINVSGKLRMLSQRIAAAACNAEEGIALETSAAMLADATAEFDRIMRALSEGDDGLGIPSAETSRMLLADLQKVEDIWGTMHVTLDAMIAGQTDYASVVSIAAQATPLLDSTVHLVSTVNAVHANPAALMQSDAMTIDVAGRQRMLAQRISKDACLILAGIEVEDTRADMVQTIAIYDASVSALRHGFEGAGITPPPSDAIAAGLDGVISDWSGLQPILQEVAVGATVDAETRAEVFTGMNTLTAKMNTLVGLYAEESKQGL